MKIAFLEDDEIFAPILVGWLEKDGFQVSWFKNARTCIKAMSDEHFDLCLFDYNLPDMSGMDVMASLKLKGTLPPVIFLTARDADQDVADVLCAGADDYIVKPCTNNVLFARIKALMRRVDIAKAPNQVVKYGNLTIDFPNRVFLLDGEKVPLTEKETELALYFMTRLGVLLSRVHLIQVVWSSSPDIDTRTIDVHISHLRKKLQLSAENGWRLASVYHQGYRLERIE